MVEVLFLIGRIVVGVFYLYNSTNHFRNYQSMVGYSRMKKVPLAEIAVPVTGLMLLLGGLSILLGIYPDVGVALLVVFLVPTALMMHNFWAVPSEQRSMEMVQFAKDMALAGSALMFLMIPEPWEYSLG